LRDIRRPDLVATKLTFGGAGQVAVDELAGKFTDLFIAHKAPDNLKASRAPEIGQHTTYRRRAIRRLFNYSWSVLVWTSGQTWRTTQPRIVVLDSTPGYTGCRSRSC